jgi:hypothetical protein
MSYVITMQQEMLPVTIDGDMNDACTEINVAAANGRTLVRLGDSDNPVVINIRNINTIRQADADDFFASA